MLTIKLSPNYLEFIETPPVTVFDHISVTQFEIVNDRQRMTAEPIALYNTLVTLSHHYDIEIV